MILPLTIWVQVLIFRAIHKKPGKDEYFEELQIFTEGEEVSTNSSINLAYKTND
jgi:hypothetical protein